VTAALLACAELAGVAHGCASSRASPPPSDGDRVGGPRSRPKPERRRSGHYRNDQPRGLGMVTNAGSQLAANGDRSHTRSSSKERHSPLADIANSGLPPESRPGIVRLIWHALKDRETSGRAGNIRRNQLEAEAPVLAADGWSRRRRPYHHTTREKAQQHVIRPRGTTA
jgi:hypothetical protein